MFDLTCKRGSVGQSEGLSIPRSSVRFRLNPDTSNSHEFELHRPSNKGTKLLLKVIKAIIIIMVKFIIKRTQVSRRTGLWWIYRLNSRSSDPLVLRVEFLLETDSGYLRDAEVTLFTLAKPEHSLCFNTHWSAPPVSAFAHSGGPRKMSQSPVSRNSHI